MYENETLLVERVLEFYPIEWRKNYYNNKKNLKIDKKNEPYFLQNIYGCYDENKNTIEIYDDNSIIHELFHTCFRDKEKLQKKIFDDENFYYSSGVSYKIYRPGKTIYSGMALTEGFVEYLSRKVCSFKGHNFEYFIVDLLISIYGEDILEYPFTNNILGFYSDKRFFDITNLKINLDQYKECVDCIKLIAKLGSSIMEKSDDYKRKQMIQMMEKIKLDFYNSVVNCIDIIVNEYKNCEHPIIDKKRFVLKINDFIVNYDYTTIINFFDYKEDLEKKFQKIIRKI